MSAWVEKPAVRVHPRGGLAAAVAIWAQVAAAGIGGPALQLATMHRLLVQSKRWISEERFFHALSYCIALPGPETQQLAVYVGWLANRTLGAVIAGGLFILHGAICMMAMSFGYVSGANSALGKAIFVGVRPAILAIMLEAMIRFGRHVLHSKWMVALSGTAFLGAFFKLPFPVIIGTAALIGVSVALLGMPAFARPTAATRAASGTTDPHTDAAGQRRPSLGQFITSLATWLTLWLAPPIVLLVIFGPDNIFSQIALLMGKVATMALGGDYAVVAYAAEQAVHSYHWLTTREMQEGIAMGEMVPGTIIIVTQFVGFIAAFRAPGSLPPLLAGTLGGLLASWMTFCPCFLWILLMAPFIERLRRNILLNSTLQAVTAAAVGMILNLSVWFGLRTLFHHIDRIREPHLRVDIPDLTSLDPWALALFACAAIAVLRFRASAVATLFVSSAAGIGLLLAGVAG
jgi:chromate transporter